MMLFDDRQDAGGQMVFLGQLDAVLDVRLDDSKR